MPVKHTIYTKDMTVEFWERSFRVKGIHAVIWTGREMLISEAKQIADTLQNMVDKVRGINNVGIKSFTHLDVNELADIKEQWLVQEKERLKDVIEDLNAENGRE